MTTTLSARWAIMLFLVLPTAIFSQTNGRDQNAVTWQNGADKLTGDFIAAYQSGDAERMATCYTVSARLGSITLTRAAIKDRYARFFNTRKNAAVMIAFNGKTAVKPITTDRASVTVPLQVTLAVKGQTKISTLLLTWTVIGGQGRRALQIVEANQLTLTDDTPPDSSALINFWPQIYFAANSDSLSAEATQRLSAFVQQLKPVLASYPAALILLEGNTDERGSSEDCLKVAQARADAVKNYLVLNGIPAANLRTISYGKEKPVCTESDDACWAKNDRVDVKDAH